MSGVCRGYVGGMSGVYIVCTSVRLALTAPIVSALLDMTVRVWDVSPGASWPEVHQGRALVYFSAKLEPCLSQENTLHTPTAP